MGLQIFAFNVWKYRKEEYRNILVVKEYGKHAVKETCPEVFGNHIPIPHRSYQINPSLSPCFPVVFAV